MTLSRNSKQTDTTSDNKNTDETPTTTSTEKSTTTLKAPSSTETSIVVRYSRDDEKLLDEISLTKNKTSSSETKADGKDVDADSDDGDDERYVTISRPYAKVSGSSFVGAQVPLLASSSIPTTPSSRLGSSSSNTLRLVFNIFWR